METTDFSPIDKPNGKKRDITTVGISRNSMQKLESVCSSLNIDKKEFLENAIEFFAKTGDDPRDPIKENLVNRLSKIENRIIGFIKTQDNDYLKVLLEDTKAGQNKLQKQKEDIEASIVDSRDFLVEALKLVVTKTREIVKPTTDQLAELKAEKSELKRLRDKINEAVGFIEQNTKKSVVGGGLTVQQAEIIGTHLKALL